MNVDLYEYNKWRQQSKKKSQGKEIFIDDNRIEEISYRPVLTPGKDAYWSPGKDPYLSVFKLTQTAKTFEAPSLNENGMISIEIEEEKFIETDINTNA